MKLSFVWLHQHRVQRKLLLVILGTSCASMLAAGVALFVYMSFAQRQSFESDASALAEIIAANCAGPVMFSDRDAAMEVMLSLKAKEQIIGAAIELPNGETFSQTGRTDLLGPGKFSSAGSVWQGDSFLIQSRPLVLHGETIGTFRLISDFGPVYERLFRTYALVFVITFAGAVLLGLGLTTRARRVITDPIRSLADTVKEMSANPHYSAPASKPEGGEMGQITDAFNVMVDRVKAGAELAKEIAERRRIELALRESEERLRSLFENAPVGLYRSNSEGRFLMANQALISLLGYPSFEELAGADIMNDICVVPSYRLHFRECIERIGMVDETEVEWRRRDGRVIYVRESAKAVRDAAGKVIYCEGCVEDITARKQAEIALRESEERFRAVVESAHDGIYVHTNRRFAYLNPAALKIFGAMSPAQLLGEPVLDRVHPDSQPGAVERMRQLNEDCLPVPSKDQVFLRLDGTAVDVEAAATPFVHQGEPGALVFLRDITARQAAAAELQRLHGELVAASRMAGMAEVATGVLHNVGNVLNSVSVSAQLLREQLGRSKFASLQQGVALMNENAAQLGTFLTEDAKGKILPGFLAKVTQHVAGEHERWHAELRQLQANIEHMKEIVAMQQSYARHSDVSEPLVAAELIEDALRMNHAGLERHQVRIERDYQDVPPVLVDKHKVLQILINLIRNAKYALDDGPSPDKQLKLKIYKNGSGRVKILVSDNGVGIPKENLTRIFQHGFTTRRDGHGFGLHSGAIAAKELGGELVAHSDGPGLGATFTLELPVAGTKN